MVGLHICTTLAKLRRCPATAGSFYRTVSTQAVCVPASPVAYEIFYFLTANSTCIACPSGCIPLRCLKNVLGFFQTSNPKSSLRVSTCNSGPVAHLEQRTQYGQTTFGCILYHRSTLLPSRPECFGLSKVSH